MKRALTNGKNENFQLSDKTNNIITNRKELLQKVEVFYSSIDKKNIDNTPQEKSLQQKVENQGS